MSDPARFYPRDYVQHSITARYGYFAQVLRPGMTPDQIRTAINNYQKLPDTDARPFARLDGDEINDFINIGRSYPQAAIR